MKSNMIRAFAFATLTLLNGCGPAALPGPTKGPVAESDVIGRWSYLGDFEKTTVEIEFTKDHKFTQTVTGVGGASKTQKGTWSLDGAWLSLDNVLLNNFTKGPSLSGWTPKDTQWWFVAEIGHLSLLGGENSQDPDQCWPLKRLP